MKKLKTLKDLHEQYLRQSSFPICKFTDSRHFLKELKAEAVKWVKEMDIYRSADYCDGMMDFIMKFFNLTSEDLK